MKPYRSKVQGRLVTEVKPQPDCGPRPLEQQRWRRHHTGTVTYGGTMSLTSGSARRKRKALARRQWVLDLQRKWAARRAVRIATPTVTVSDGDLWVGSARGGAVSLQAEEGR